MTDREIYVQVFCAVMNGGYMSRVSSFFSDPQAPEELIDYAKRAAYLAIHYAPKQSRRVKK